MQALPARHPIVSSVSADRAARQAASGVSADTLTAAGAQPLLGRAWDASPAAVRGSCSSAHCDKLLSAAAASEGEGGGGEGHRPKSGSAQELLFCSNSWLVQVDKRTGEPAPCVAAAVAWGQHRHMRAAVKQPAAPAIPSAQLPLWSGTATQHHAAGQSLLGGSSTPCCPWTPSVLCVLLGCLQAA